MSENCKKACDLCGGVACIDDNDNCPRWAQAGYCSGRCEVYMRENCKKSCNVCKVMKTQTRACFDIC